MRTLVIVAALLAMGFAGCRDADTCRCTPPPPPPIPPPPNSPANVLATLQIAYAEQNIELYRTLFAEDFTFVFNTVEHVDPAHPIPVQWPLADELAATAHMFSSERVDRIELSSYMPGLLERADSLRFGARAWRVRVDEVHLRVDTETEGGTPLAHVVDGTTEVFYFREEPSKPVNGRPSWSIFRWEDQPIEGAKSEIKSWGWIKALFR